MKAWVPALARCYALALILMPLGAARAADNGVYLGFSVGETTSDLEWSLGFPSSDSIADDDGYKLIGGIRPIDSLAIEIDFADFGTTTGLEPLLCITPPCGSLAYSLDARALSVSVVGLYTLPSLDLFGRMGVANWETSERQLGFPVASSSIERDGSDLTYGIGMQIRFSSYALRIEYESFDLGNSSTELVSVGFTYTFL